MNAMDSATLMTPALCMPIQNKHALMLIGFNTKVVAANRTDHFYTLINHIFSTCSQVNYHQKTA